VGEKFDLSKSSLNECVRRVVKTLNSIADEIIKWPTGLRLEATKTKFTHLGNILMLGIIGAVDGSYIYIKKPNLQVFFFLIFDYYSKFYLL